MNVPEAPRTEADKEELPQEQAEEPSVDSDNREMRIAARRKRVLLKIEADRRAAMGKEPSDVRPTG